MNNITTIKNIYFIGIGGIGMSAIARYFHAQGALVSGYDRTRTPLTVELEQSGIVIHYDENINALSKEADVVVYTPAIPADHKELIWYREHNYTVVKRSDILQWITANSLNICIAGTHGKTTTTTITAHILRHSGYGCNAFLGGIAANYNTNFWASENNTVVVEADEYDRSFLKLHPSVAAITAMDPDHLDIYGTAEEFEKAFVEFSTKVKPGGLLLTKYGLPHSEQMKADKHLTYSLQDVNADVYVTNIQVIDGSYKFNVISKFWQLHDVVLSMGGLHNIENSIVAITIAKHLGISDDKIKAAIADFKGVKRRFEYIIKQSGLTLIDDYAHHPEELKALISGVRSLYPNEKMTLVFQPHLFSRTKDQADGFAEVLSTADEVILLPIYPARELPMPGVQSEMIAEKMKNKNVSVKEKTEMIEYIKTHKPALVIMAGAGDIDALVNEVKNVLIA